MHDVSALPPVTRDTCGTQRIEHAPVAVREGDLADEAGAVAQAVEPRLCVEVDGRDQVDGGSQGKRARVGVDPAEPEGAADEELHGVSIGSGTSQLGDEALAEAVVRALLPPPA